MESGLPGFRQGFTCPAVLGIRTGDKELSRTGLSPAMARFPHCSASSLFGNSSGSCTSPGSVPQPHIWQRVQLTLRWVWARPRSLAATEGVSFDFLSCRYLDVSVPCVRAWRQLFRLVGYPIRRSADQGLRTAPRSLSQLIASFVASQRLGIRHLLLVACSPYSHPVISHGCGKESQCALGLATARRLSLPPLCEWRAIACVFLIRRSQVVKERVCAGQGGCCGAATRSGCLATSRSFLANTTGNCVWPARWCIPLGGAEGVRTPDPRLAKPMLSQLSYSPVCSSSGQRWVALWGQPADAQGT